MSYDPRIFNHSNYLVRRKIMKLIGASFHIFDANNNVIMYSKMKGFKLREDIRLYTDESMTTEILTISARNIIDISATYDVYDSNTQQKIGALQRQGLKSMLKDEWKFLDANDNEIGFIKEDSMVLALVRRFLTNLIPQTYDVEIQGQKVCEFKQNMNPFVMKINVDFSGDQRGLLDRRLGIAAAILMCAIEGKQN